MNPQNIVSITPMKIKHDNDFYAIKLYAQLQIIINFIFARGDI